MKVPFLNRNQKLVLLIGCAAFVLTLFFVRWEKAELHGSSRHSNGYLTIEFNDTTTIYGEIAPLWSGPDGYTIQVIPLFAQWFALFAICAMLLLAFRKEDLAPEEETFGHELGRSIMNGFGFMLVALAIILILRISGCDPTL